jgi:hypothetical protein
MRYSPPPGYLVCSGALGAVIRPLWTSYPTLGQGAAAALLELRSDMPKGRGRCCVSCARRKLVTEVTGRRSFRAFAVPV